MLQQSRIFLGSNIDMVFDSAPEGSSSGSCHVSLSCPRPQVFATCVYILVHYNMFILHLPLLGSELNKLVLVFATFNKCEHNNWPFNCIISCFLLKKICITHVVFMSCHHLKRWLFCPLSHTLIRRHHVFPGVSVCVTYQKYSHTSATSFCPPC